MAAGASHPPLSASVRALWPQVLPAQHLREAAYAVEATLQELFFVTGPLLVAVIATFSPAAALLTTAALGLVGTLAFAATHPSRAARGRHRDAPRPGRAMASGGLRTIVLVCVAHGHRLRCRGGGHAGVRRARGHPRGRGHRPGLLLGRLAAGRRGLRGAAGCAQPDGALPGGAGAVRPRAGAAGGRPVAVGAVRAGAAGGDPDRAHVRLRVHAWSTGSCPPAR